MATTLSATDKAIIRTAAYGAVTLMSFAGIAGSAHRAATDGTLALASATGLAGHLLAEKTRDLQFNYKSAAALADQVLPALTASMNLLKRQAPAEAENFRSAVIVAVEAAAHAQGGQTPPTMAVMAHKITAALNA